MMAHRGTTSSEQPVEGPRCNVWFLWTLLGAGILILVAWAGWITVSQASLSTAVEVNTTNRVKQYEYIIYRLDQIDKKLDKLDDKGKEDKP